MAGYIQAYQSLVSKFNLDQDQIILEDSLLTIHNFTFETNAKIVATDSESVDNLIEQNNRFRYPVLTSSSQSKDVIILLHGLNERTWHKHLTGARYLAEQSGKAVLMFPLSYHINRGLPDWINPRKMAGALEKRKNSHPGIREASVVNLALSERLTVCPERFFHAGLQSTMDLIRLMDQIRNGEHPLFEKGTRIQIFAYSISCMLIQSLIISNPNNILKDTKIVLFAGGSIFSKMQGISKFIMDNVAFDIIKKHYTQAVLYKKDFLKNLQPGQIEYQFADAFRSIVLPDFLRRVRMTAFRNFSDQLMVLALREDKIMPINGIREAFGSNFLKSAHSKILHFPYDYTHENPFPVLYERLDEQVDDAFHSVYESALKFLV